MQNLVYNKKKEQRDRLENFGLGLYGTKIGDYFADP
jgi:hypothetical protein